MVSRLEGGTLHLWDGEAEHVVHWGAGVCLAAAHLDALGVLKWLQQHGHPDFCWTRLWVFAAAGGSMDTLRWLRSHRCDWSALTCEAACRGGSLSALKWLRCNGCDWDERSLQAALRRGDREMVTWLHQNGAPFDWSTALTAAYYGDLPTLRWLHQAGCPCDAGVLEGAARHGHLDILQWGRQQVVPPIPWTYRVAYCAVESSQSHCLEFAIAHGCPWWPKRDAPGFPCTGILMLCYRLRAPLPEYAVRRVAAQKVRVTATLCLVSTTVALPVPIASDIAKLVYDELLTI